jgi:hypothetical protein
MLPAKFGSIWQSIFRGSFQQSLVEIGSVVSEEKIFLTLANQKKELILATMFVGQMERNGETL